MRGRYNAHDKTNTLVGCTGHHLQVITMSWFLFTRTCSTNDRLMVEKRRTGRR